MHYHLSHLPEVRAAMDAAAACRDIDELTAAVHAFDAHPTCRRPAMPGRAGDHCDLGRPVVMLLGKSPAATETETRVPFSGPMGQVLREEMDIAGLDVDACWLACATPWPAKDNTPNATQLAISRPFLVREIELVAPALVVALGQKAHEALVQRAEPLGDKPGRHETMTFGGATVDVAWEYCHAAVGYARPQKAPGFRRRLQEAVARHPEAHAAIRIDRRRAA